MKIDAIVEWVIDDDALHIESGTTIKVPVDMDYVEPEEADIIQCIEDYLFQAYGTSFRHSCNEDDNGDFIIKNMDGLLEGIEFDEFKSKTQI